MNKDALLRARLMELAHSRLEARPMALAELRDQVENRVGSPFDLIQWSMLTFGMPHNVSFALANGNQSTVDRWLLTQIDEWAAKRTFLDSADFAPLPPIPTTSHSLTSVTSADAPAAWPLQGPPLRDDGLAGVLRDTLIEMRTAGRPKPTAQQVLSEWRRNKPARLHLVDDNQVKFFDSEDVLKIVGIPALGERIRRMTTPDPSPSPR